MSKPITEEQIAEFRAFCEEQLNDDEDSGVASFSLCGVPMCEEMLDDGVTCLWESCPDSDESHDIVELFGEVSDEYVIEQDGYEDFYLSRVEPGTVLLYIGNTSDGAFLINATSEEEAYKAVVGDDNWEEPDEDLEWNCTSITLKPGEPLDPTDYI